MVHLVATLSVQSSTMSYWRMMARAEALSSRSGCGTASTPELRVARVVARLAALLTPSLASECATWRCRLLYCTVLYCTVLYCTVRHLAVQVAGLHAVVVHQAEPPHTRPRQVQGRGATQT